jgi:hypothetical protein
MASKFDKRPYHGRPGADREAGEGGESGRSSVGGRRTVSGDREISSPVPPDQRSTYPGSTSRRAS